MAEEFLRRVYDLQTQDDTDAYYSAWAATYDQEMSDQGYRSPQRCAEALAKFVPGDAAVLDIGCGTGVSGAALAAAGFTNIAGNDVNPDMLKRATEIGVYRETWVADIETPFPFAPGTYAAIAAVGVIGIGAAPASLLPAALNALGPGGHVVFSYNDYALENPEYIGVVTHAIESGEAAEVFCEHGPHFEGLGSGSNVYVLRKNGNVEHP